MDRKGCNDMLKDEKSPETWDTGSHENFYKFYEQQSLTPETLERFRVACETLLRIYGPLPPDRQLDVLDVGCGAGTQSRFWTQGNHRYWGIDINEPLVQLARMRAAEQGIDARFDIGSATALPCGDQSVDICLLPELLEHVADWQGCLNEAIRVLRPGGLIYINTSSKLCPKQQEFNLPLYGWYPHRLKRYFEHRAVTDRPDLANYAKYPAVNWFSFYGLRQYLEPKGFACLDRFDLVDLTEKSTLVSSVLILVHSLAPLRFIGHVLTPYTLLVARKSLP
jgi:2-polyprenyl-6-hydroxyphenyl methylase/3-demethylubiquinone-9 3-methyltransferase